MTQTNTIYCLYVVPCTKDGKRKFQSITRKGYCKKDYDKLMQILKTPAKNYYDKEYSIYFSDYKDAQLFAFGEIL